MFLMIVRKDMHQSFHSVMFFGQGSLLQKSDRVFYYFWPWKKLRDPEVVTGLLRDQEAGLHLGGQIESGRPGVQCVQYTFPHMPAGS